MNFLESVAKLLHTKLIIKDRNILKVEVSSPSSLESILPKVIKENKRCRRYIALAVSEGQIFVFPFYFRDILPESLDDQIKLKAVELLNLPVDQIILDFQIFGKLENEVWGVYTCIPKLLVEKYLEVLDSVKVSPIRMVPLSLVSIDSFWQNHKEGNGRNCILDLTKKNMVCACIIQEDKCEMFREIPYEQIEDAVKDIDQTIHSASSKSRIKQLNHVLYFGDSQEARQIVFLLGQKLNKEVEHRELNDMLYSLKPRGNVFSINLIKNYSLSLAQRANIELILKSVFLFLVFIAVTLTFRILEREVQILDMESLYTSDQYNKALELQRKLDSL